MPSPPLLPRFDAAPQTIPSAARDVADPDDDRSIRGTIVGSGTIVGPRLPMSSDGRAARRFRHALAGGNPRLARGAPAHPLRARHRLYLRGPLVAGLLCCSPGRARGTERRQ